MNIDWSVEQFVWNDRFNNWQTNRIAGDNDLDKAKYFLSNRFDFVGLTERYNESLIILKQLLGVESFQIQYSRANTSDKNKKLKNIDLIRFNELPDEIKNRIVENNKLDLELYDFVKNVVFPTYESEYKGDLKQAVDQLLQLNETFTLNKILHLKNKILRRYLKFVLRFTSHDYIY